MTYNTENTALSFH